MRLLLPLLLVSLAIPVCASATPKQHTLTFEKVIDGATIIASGKTVVLWGLKALDQGDPVSFAANAYLETVAGAGTLTCDEVSVDGDRHIMHCYSDGADIGSLMVQLGLAEAANPYYQAEQVIAQGQHRGVWHTKQGKSL